MKDAQIKSLHQQVDPQICFEFSGFGKNEPILFKVKDNPQEAIRAIEKKWNELNPKTPFEYNFLDARYARMYRAETASGQIPGVAMMITFTIGVAVCYGILYNSAAFKGNRHQKSARGFRFGIVIDIEPGLLCLGRNIFSTGLPVGLSFCVALDGRLYRPDDYELVGISAGGSDCFCSFLIYS